MALNIKDPETDRLARELAGLTGETITVALKRAVEDRISAVRVASEPRKDLSDIIARGRARRTADDRPADEILGYDSRGLPT